MSIPVECPVCQSQHSVNERMAGREVRCPTCDEIVVVPDVVPEPVVEDDIPTAIEAIVEDEIAEALPVEAVGAIAAGPVVASAQSIADKIAREAMAVARPADEVDDDFEDEEIDDEEFAAAFRRPKREDEELDMTPMVDVTFLLLIFFMVTASFSLQKSIEMPRQTSDLPSMSNTEEIIDELDVVELEIDEFGAFMVLSPDWEREAPGKQNLINTLKDAMAERSGGMKLTIKVHEMAKLQSLVDGMDSGAIAGYSEIKVTQVDGFD